MEKEFVAAMRSELMSQKESIIQTLMAENDDFRAIVEDMDPKDLADIAADDIDKKNLEALGVAELKKIRLIDSALARIENGRYGFCMDCQKPIPRARLEAIPYALSCVDCQTQKEKRHRLSLT